MPPVEYYYARELLTGGLNVTLRYPRWVEFTGEQEARFRQLYDIMLQRTLAEPRAVNRFLGQVAAYLPLIDPAELDLVDLLTLIHLRSFVPSLRRPTGCSPGPRPRSRAPNPHLNCSGTPSTSVSTASAGMSVMRSRPRSPGCFRWCVTTRVR
jgi:hypothetical protein